MDEERSWKNSNYAELLQNNPELIDNILSDWVFCAKMMENVTPDIGGEVPWHDRVRHFITQSVEEKLDDIQDAFEDYEENEWDEDDIPF